MLISKILNYIKGCLTIIIDGLFPERFINICTRNNVPLWNIRREDKTRISADMSIYDFKKIRKFGKKSRCRIHITKKYGLPFFLHRYRKRKVLAAGVAVFFILLHIMTRFVWIIEITGNEKISQEDILTCAAQAGLYAGMKTSDVDSSEIQRRIMTDMDEIGFVSVNRTGTTVHIDIREREEKREHFDKDTPTNIVAAESGVIESTLVQSGSAVVTKGDVVYKGQLLVSGANDSKAYGIKYSRSDAKIMARVWHEKTVQLPAYSEEKHLTGNIIKKKKLKIFNFSVNLFIKNKILFEKYDILSYTKYITLGEGKILPIGIETTTYTEYTEKRTKLSQSELKKQLTEEMDNLYSGCEIVNRTFTTKDNTMTVTYECIEDIAKEEEINDGREISGS